MPVLSILVLTASLPWISLTLGQWQVAKCSNHSFFVGSATSPPEWMTQVQACAIATGSPLPPVQQMMRENEQQIRSVITTVTWYHLVAQLGFVSLAIYSYLCTSTPIPILATTFLTMGLLYAHCYTLVSRLPSQLQGLEPFVFSNGYSTGLFFATAMIFISAAVAFSNIALIGECQKLKAEEEKRKEPSYLQHDWSAPA